MDVLDIFSAKGTLTRQVLPGPSSRKHVPKDMSLLDNELNATMRSLESGTDYVAEFVEKEEKELLESMNNYNTNDKSNFELVSHGTEAVQDLCTNEDTLKIYKTYDFAHQLKNNLSITSKRDQIVSMVETNSVVVIEGPTGCGKTTQVPQFILDSCYKKRLHCNIIDFMLNNATVFRNDAHLVQVLRMVYKDSAIMLLDIHKKRNRIERLSCSALSDMVFELTPDTKSINTITQPRRIAAISIAKRVSQERNWPVGTLVGYQVGLINHTCPETRLTFCTTGVLLHKLINTKNLLDYTHIILDEVHERDQDMDFLLLVVRKLLRTNSRLVKVILMSATFQVDKFAKYFSSPVRDKLVPAPIVDISKRRYFNIGTFYLCQMPQLGPYPDVSPSEPRISKKMMEYCTNLIKILDDMDMKADDANYDPETNTYERHVILMFLPGIHEIEDMHNLLSLPKHKQAKWDILVLHSSITNEEQQRIFHKPPRGYRRVILSTNIAESSITVPDVKYVIDFCLTKQLVIDPKTNFQCLELTWASKANCDQRAGRTGRVMDGRVYRLVPQAFYESVLPKESPPEILRAPLANVVLKSKLLDMGEPKAILALSLDPPDLGNLERTILLLKESGAMIDKPNDYQHFDGELTDLGRVMGSLPVDIQITKLIMLGHVYSILKDMIIIAACLAVKDMFNSPFQEKLLAYNVRLNWANNASSDCIAFMNVYKVWIREKASRRISDDASEKKWAQRNYVQIRVLREVKALIVELTRRLERLGVKESEGVNKVVWTEKERPIVLKFVIAGAFYPNYFIKHVPDGQANQHAGIKLLNGLDPATTVYVQGWPLRQPGLLYAKRIQDIFVKEIGSYSGKVRVSFDSSTRIYVQFIKDEFRGSSNNRNNDNITKKISNSVYKAIRMRQVHIPLEIPILNDDVANDLAEKQNLKRKQYFTCSSDIKSRIAPRLPGLRSSHIPIIIQHVASPGRFWVQVRDSRVRKEIERITCAIEVNLNFLDVFTTPPETGTVVIAPYEANNCRSYFRAIVEGHITSPEVLVQLSFIDYGYASECRLRDLRRIDNAEVADVPALAIECVLAKVEPSPTQNLDNSWSEAAYDFFWMLVHKPGQLFGDIYSVVNGVMSLELVLKTGEEEISINRSLVDKGFAIEKEEGYFSRFNHDLRMRQADMSDEQCSHYEQLQYNQDYMLDNYPDPPKVSDCYTTVNLRGPFSPLEIELKNLTIASRGKMVHVGTNSVNAVLLDTDPDDTSQRLLVAGSVSQSAHSNNLTLYNTTLMPRLSGLTALVVLVFAPSIELRRDTYGTHYIGALCGLGFHPETKKSLFPEHDIQLQFDAEITIDDLQYINRLRHWMNIGMQVNHESNSRDNMEETVICQNRLKDALLVLIEKSRKPQELEMVNNFDMWNLYDENLYLRPSRTSMVINNIYKLHNALELEETDQLQEVIEHVKKLRALTTEDPRKPGTTNIICNVCQVVLNDLYDLRSHLFSNDHRDNEKKLGIQL